MNLLQSILANALSHPGKLAVRDDRRTYTYAQLAGGAFFAAERIDALTAAPHIGIMLPTSGAFPIALLGTWLARRTAVALNYLLSKDELAYIIADSDIDTIITARAMIDFLGGPSALPPNIRLVFIEDFDFTGLPPLRWPPLTSPDDLAILLYTSGTSAKPKGVMLTHRNLSSNVEACLIHAGITPVSGFLGVLPQFHSFGLTALTLLPLFAGAEVTYTARFVPRRIVDLIRHHRPSVVMFVPAMYSALLAVKETTADDFKSIEIAVSGGEALPRATFNEYLNRFNLRLLEGYGLTETSPVLTWSTLTRNRLGAVGPTFPGTGLRGVTVAIADENNRFMPPGAGVEGEILAAGPNIMKGYYKRPEDTAAVIVDLPYASHATAKLNGTAGEPAPLRFFRTGDIGKVDSDGYLYITGRKKEMFKVAGEIVFPRVIEEVLNQHPSVNASAVIPKPDEMRGEVPLAFVELKEGQPFDETALRSWCRDKLANFQVPREIRLIDKLPRNPTGKIMKRQLKADPVASPQA